MFDEEVQAECRRRQAAEAAAAATAVSRSPRCLHTSRCGAVASMTVSRNIIAMMTRSLYYGMDLEL
jgi:hypothetical protein